MCFVNRPNREVIQPPPILDDENYISVSRHSNNNEKLTIKRKKTSLLEGLNSARSVLRQL